jgi:hypothetical protein
MWCESICEWSCPWGKRGLVRIQTHPIAAEGRFFLLLVGVHVMGNRVLDK